MTLIPCADNCIYQQDGFCRMETPSIVTGSVDNGCIHKIEPNKKITCQDIEKPLLHSLPQ